MAFQQAKVNFSCVRRAHSQSPPDYQIDEALWAAYRRYDKSAVTEKLLRHYLPGLARIRELNAAGDGVANPFATKLPRQTISGTAAPGARNVLKPIAHVGKISCE